MSKAYLKGCKGVITFEYMPVAKKHHMTRLAVKDRVVHDKSTAKVGENPEDHLDQHTARVVGVTLTLLDRL